MMTPEELQTLRKKVNDTLKEPSLTSMIPDPDNRIINGVNTGSMMLNISMSGNPFVGYAWGRIAEIYGPESSGKTTLALHAIKEVQVISKTTDIDLPVLFIDMEHSLDAYYAEALGIDMSMLTIAQPNCAEEALNAVEEAIKAGFKLVVVDSVSALTPRAEVEGGMGESHVGLQARLMSQACRKLTPLVMKNEAILIFINQIRMKIGVIFGNPETTSGGNALKFYATYRLEIRAPRTGKHVGNTLMGYDNTIEESQELSTTVNVTVKKNKVFPPHRKASFVIEYGKGIDRVKDLVAFLEYSGAFVAPKANVKVKNSTGKPVAPVLRLPVRKKSYTATGLRKLLKTETDQKALAEIYDIIEERESRRDV
jgi:recombination protein RecA